MGKANIEPEASETFLANCAEIILNVSEEEKSHLCDLKFICPGDSQLQVFNSFRLLLLATSPEFMKEIFCENDDESVIVLPEDITYDNVLNFHRCLLLTDNNLNNQADCLQSSLELINLLQISLKSTPIENEKKIDETSLSKVTLKCVECGKEYVNLACFRYVVHYFP